MPPDLSRRLAPRCSTRLSQNPSYGPDLLELGFREFEQDVQTYQVRSLRTLSRILT